MILNWQLDRNKEKTNLCVCKRDLKEEKEFDLYSGPQVTTGHVWCLEINRKPETEAELRVIISHKFILLFIREYAVPSQELFVRLVPYHCLGSLWSQRDKKGREGVCWSVRATVRQFNKLANAVLASCLCATMLRSQQRARLLEKWISVAEVRGTKTPQGHRSEATNIHLYSVWLKHGVWIKEVSVGGFKSSKTLHCAFSYNKPT